MRAELKQARDGYNGVSREATVYQEQREELRKERDELLSIREILNREAEQQTKAIIAQRKEINALEVQVNLRYFTWCGEEPGEECQTNEVCDMHKDNGP